MRSLVCNGVARSWSSRAKPWILAVHDRSCRHRPPKRVPRVHPASGQSPFRARSRLSTFPTRRPDPPCPRFRLPLTTQLRASSTMRRAVPDPPRIRSQAFSTSQRFLQSQFSWPCFMPQPFAGYPPSESSPRRDRGVLSDPPAASVIHPRALCTTPDVFTLDFTDVRAFDAVAWIPTNAKEAHSPQPEGY